MPTAYLSPSQLKELTDVSVSPGAGQNDYPLTWNNTTGRWVASNNIAGVTVRAGAGSSSQAIGSTANSSGGNWIAQGVLAGHSNTLGISWMAQGSLAGYSNTLGNNWMAQGSYAAALNSLGNFWIAQSSYAGYSNTTGNNWMAQGPYAGYSNTVGDAWIAQGSYAGYSNTLGNSWMAQGGATGYFNTVGHGWSAQGFEAGYYDTRSNFLNIANSRSKSLICGDFSNNCIYFGHAGSITSSATVPTPTAAVHAAASNTTRASLRIDPGSEQNPTFPPTIRRTGDVWINTSNNSLNFQVPYINLQETQLLGPRCTGWSAPTGIATRATFATSTATTQQLAERLKALIDDLSAHGLIGT